MIIRCSLLIFLLLSLQTASASDLESLGFMEGHWKGGDGAYEEVWLAPHGVTMTGSFRWVMGNGRTVLEYLVIEQTKDDVIFRFKHFNPDYKSWETEPNTYRLESVDEASAQFVRIGDYDRVPKVMEYRREGDVLTFTGLGDDPSEGDPLVLVFELAR